MRGGATKTRNQIVCFFSLFWLHFSLQLLFVLEHLNLMKQTYFDGAFPSFIQLLMHCSCTVHTSLLRVHEKRTNNVTIHALFITIHASFLRTHDKRTQKIKLDHSPWYKIFKKIRK
jgi:hypothetical protein